MGRHEDAYTNGAADFAHQLEVHHTEFHKADLEVFWVWRAARNGVVNWVAGEDSEAGLHYGGVEVAQH